MKSNLLRALSAVSLFALCIVTRATESAKSVVFVCEHGSVKSVMAASYFNRMAAEQKINVRAMARGTTPDAEVPAWAVEKLKADGFDVAAFTPQKLGSTEATQAVTVVAFCEVPREIVGAAKVTSWLDIPSVSPDYDKAKAIMMAKIAPLLADVKTK